MSVARPSGRPPATAEAIQLVVQSPGGRDDATRWGLLLAIFMRVVAMLWLAFGLLQWSFILGQGPASFDRLDFSAQMGVGFFAVFDLTAAVGLWLCTPWGGVLWLFAVAAQVFATLAAPQVFNGGRGLLAGDVVLVIGYFVLTWFAARERDT